MKDYTFSYSSFASTSYSPLLSKDDQEFDERPHVLVAEHGLIYRRYMKNVFASFGCKVTSVDNGQKALEFLGLGDGQCTNCRCSNVNLIITEYDMPRITGYELLKKLKESPNLKEIPVVIVSSEDLKSRIKGCGEAGAQKFLLKPLKLEDLEKLRNYIM